MRTDEWFRKIAAHERLASGYAVLGNQCCMMKERSAYLDKAAAHASIAAIMTALTVGEESFAVLRAQLADMHCRAAGAHDDAAKMRELRRRMLRLARGHQ